MICCLTVSTGFTTYLDTRIVMITIANPTQLVGKNPMRLRFIVFFFSSRRRHTRLQGDWSSDVCSSDLHEFVLGYSERRAAVRDTAAPASDARAGRDAHRRGSDGDAQGQAQLRHGAAEIGRASCRERV